MRSSGRCAGVVLIAAGFCFAGAGASHGPAGRRQAGSTTAVAADQSGPTFVVNDQDLHAPLTLIAYGDIRFTDPANVTATSPMARQALIQRVLEEKPDAILLNGDVPWHGGDKNDYEVYRTETQVWRDA